MSDQITAHPFTCHPSWRVGLSIYEISPPITDSCCAAILRAKHNHTHQSYASKLSNCSTARRRSSSLFRTGWLAAFPCAASSRCMPLRQVSSRPGRTGSTPRGRRFLDGSSKLSSRVFFSSARLRATPTYLEIKADSMSGRAPDIIHPAAKRVQAKSR